MSSSIIAGVGHSAQNEVAGNMRHAVFARTPEVVLPFEESENYLGPALVSFDDNTVMMVVARSRPPADIESRLPDNLHPDVFVSRDAGCTWTRKGELNLPRGFSGKIANGGSSLLRLSEDRLVLALHRCVEGLHGGGVPLFFCSHDNGRNWERSSVSGSREIIYLMNNRLIRLSCGRLLAPVACRQGIDLDGDYIEGDRTEAGCYISDDDGSTWRPGLVEGRAALELDLRGMAEPAVVELDGGRIMMLARTGAGSLFKAYSHDAGESWSRPTKTSLASPCSSFSLERLGDGLLLVVYNHAAPVCEGAFFPRTPLVYAVSSNDGDNWSEPFVIDNSGLMRGDTRQHVYPALCPVRDGVLLVYSTHPAPLSGEFNTEVAPAGPDCGMKCAVIRI